MSDDKLIPFSPANHQLGPQLQLTSEEKEKAVSYIKAASAENTLRAYRADWEDWLKWCQSHQVQSLPARPEAVAAYLSELGGSKKPSTIGRRLAAIAKAHDVSRLPSPTREAVVREVMAGIKRTHGTRPRKAKAITLNLLSEMINKIPMTTPGWRDRALLLVGFAGAFRRSEFTSIQFEDLTWGPIQPGKRVPDHVLVLIPKSKTDKESAGQVVALVANHRNQFLCPVLAIMNWLTVSGIRSGFIFRGWTDSRFTGLRSGHLHPCVVSEIIKKLVKDLGIDPSHFSAHSLRRGHVTYAVSLGISLPDIQKTTRHKNLQTLIGYNEAADAVTGSSAALIWNQKKP